MNTSSEASSPTKQDSSTFLQRLEWKEIDQEYLQDVALRSRQEDLEGFGLSSPPDRSGDRTSEALELTGQGAALLVARQPMVLCGQGLIPYLLEHFGGQAKHETHQTDGSWVESGTVLGKIWGNRITLLAAERSLLNFIQRLSGIASTAKTFVDALSSAGKTALLDTRKTTPGHRVLEKYAVATGGGWNHRFGLFDRIMIKDNHIAVEGNIYNLVKKAIKNKKGKKITVEVDNLSQLKKILGLKFNRILFDNMNEKNLRKGIKLTKNNYETEASGGISLKNVRKVASTGVKRISVGQITHSAPSINLKLEI